MFDPDTASHNASLGQLFVYAFGILIVLPSFMYGLWAIFQTPARLFGSLSSGNLGGSGASVHGARRSSPTVATAATVSAADPPQVEPSFWARLAKAQANLVLVFLNIAFIIVMGLISVISAGQLALAVRHGFRPDDSIRDIESNASLILLDKVAIVAQVLYFWTSIWMKHRLVRSLPGSSYIATWSVSVLLTIIATGPLVSLSIQKSMLTTLLLFVQLLCMTIVAWLYVLLAISTVRHSETSVLDALRIVRGDKILRSWLLMRPSTVLIITFVPALGILAAKKDLHLIGPIVVISDFLFEYSQIHYGLFAKLVKEISLPPSVREKIPRSHTVSRNDNGDCKEDRSKTAYISFLEAMAIPLPNSSLSKSHVIITLLIVSIVILCNLGVSGWLATQIMAGDPSKRVGIKLFLALLGLLMTVDQILVVSFATAKDEDTSFPIGVAANWAAMICLCLLMQLQLEWWVYGVISQVVILSLFSGIQAYVIVSKLLETTQTITNVDTKSKHRRIMLSTMLTVLLEVIGILTYAIGNSLTSDPNNIAVVETKAIMRMLAASCLGVETISQTVALLMIADLVANRSGSGSDSAVKKTMSTPSTLSTEGSLTHVHSVKKVSSLSGQTSRV
eukprot:jgi/Hompol1/5237/HPOL_004270-RA